MAAGGEKSSDLYAVLGLKKECSATELRSAYKKLALRWHPDRCSASGNSKFVEEAKKKFQAIQEAYSVLSDANKRFLYDVGASAYDSSDDDDEIGMADFLGEMAMMMSQANSSGKGEESFEELQELFEEMFQRDMSPFGSSSQGPSSASISNMGSGKADTGFSFMEGGQSFCLGAEDGKESRGNSRRKHKVSSSSSRRQDFSLKCG